MYSDPGQVGKRTARTPRPLVGKPQLPRRCSVTLHRCPACDLEYLTAPGCTEPNLNVYRWGGEPHFEAGGLIPLTSLPRLWMRDRTTPPPALHPGPVHAMRRPGHVLRPRHRGRMTGAARIFKFSGSWLTPAPPDFFWWQFTVPFFLGEWFRCLLLGQKVIGGQKGHRAHNVADPCPGGDLSPTRAGEGRHQNLGRSRTG